MKNISNSNIPLFTKADTVLNTPGQFFFQITEEYDIKYGKNNTLNKKKVDEIKTNIQLIFKKIAENLKQDMDKDFSYYKSIIKKLEKFSNAPFRFPGLQVINLTKDHIEVFSSISERILICEKSDGVRYLLIHFVNDITLFLGRNMEFYFVELNFKLPRRKHETGVRSEWEIENFLDGELILDRVDEEKFTKNENLNLPKNLVYINDKLHEVKFLVFDGVIVCGTNIGNLKFRNRLRKVNEFFLVKELERKFMSRYRDKIETSIFESMNKKMSNETNNSITTHISPNTKFKIDMFMKDYFTFDKMEFLYNKLILAKILPHENDGVIINLDDYPYYTGQASEIYKWKPANLNTIDFEITTVQSHSEKRTLYVLNVFESRDKLMPIACLFFPDDNEYERFSQEYQEIAVSGKGAIAECFYNFQFNNDDTINFHLLCDREVIRRSDSNYTGLQNLHNYNFKFVQQELTTNKKLNLKKFEFGSWQFLRFRRDKLLPNSSYTYFSIMKTIMENVQMTDLMSKIEENRKKGIKIKLDVNQSLAMYLKNCLKVDNNSPSLFEADDMPTMKIISQNNKNENIENEKEGQNKFDAIYSNQNNPQNSAEDLLKKKRGIDTNPSNKLTYPKIVKKKEFNEEDINKVDYSKIISIKEEKKIKFSHNDAANSETPIHVENPEFSKKTTVLSKKEKEKEKREKSLKQANQSLSLAFSSTITTSKIIEERAIITNSELPGKSSAINNVKTNEVSNSQNKNANFLLNDDDSLEESSSD